MIVLLLSLATELRLLYGRSSLGQKKRAFLSSISDFAELDSYQGDL